MRLSLIDDLTGELGPRGSLLYSSGCCESPPEASFTHTSLGGYTINLSATASNEIGEYVWNLGDGNVIETTEPSIDYTYLSLGRYEVCLTVVPVDGSGCINTYCLDVEVCNFDFDVGFTIDENEFVVTLNAGDGNVTAYNWDFGDGNTATGQNVIHEYDESGGLFMTVLPDKTKTSLTLQGFTTCKIAQMEKSLFPALMSTPNTCM